MKSLPKLFIGSSTESLDTANTIQEVLQYDADSTVWTQNVFKPGFYPLESLLNIINDFSFAIFVFTPEDITIIRNKQYMVIRDNLIFEYGMFVAKLGKEKTFFLLPENSDGVHLPSDLLGLTPIKIQYKSDDLIKSLSPACNIIRRQINEFYDQEEPIVFSKEQYKYFLQAKRMLFLDVENYFKDEMTKPSVIALDIDSFTVLNKVYGLKVADKLKCDLEKLINHFLALRLDDSIYSYHVGNLGSDEFYIFMNDDDSHKVFDIAVELLKTIEENDWGKFMQNCQLTCSAGIAYRKNKENIEELLIRSLRATKLSKLKGGNCVSKARNENIKMFSNDLFYYTS